MIYSFANRHPSLVPYKDVVDNFVGREGCTIGFVVFDEGGLSAQGRTLISGLFPYLVASERTLKWPGTTQLAGKGVEMFTYELNHQSAEIITNCAESLFDWLEPELPEDLFILDRAHVERLVSVVHEGEAFLTLEPSDLLAVRLLAEGRIVEHVVSSPPE